MRSGKAISKNKLKNIVFLLVLALAVAIAWLALLESADGRFFRAAERGVMSGWSHKDAEKNLREAGKPHDTSFIDDEYEAVNPFRNADFRSKRVERSAKEYIQAIRDCKSVTDKYDPDKDFDLFWRHFSDPYGRRIKALYDLQHSSAFFSFESEEHKGEIAELMVQGWALNEAERISFSTKNMKNGDREYTASVKNSSGYGLDFIDLTVDLYDKNNKLLSSNSAYVNDIKRNETVKLIFYEAAPAKAANYRVTAVNCSRKQ